MSTDLTLFNTRYYMIRLMRYSMICSITIIILDISSYLIRSHESIMPEYVLHLSLGLSYIFRMSSLSILRSMILFPTNILYTLLIHDSDKEDTLWGLLSTLDRRSSIYSKSDDHVLLSELLILSQQIGGNRYMCTKYLTQCMHDVLTSFRYTASSNHRLLSQYYFWQTKPLLHNDILTIYHNKIRERIREELVYINPIRYATNGLGIVIAGGALFTIINQKYVAEKILNNSIHNTMHKHRRSIIIYSIVSALDLVRNVVISEKYKDIKISGKILHTTDTEDMF